MWNSALVRAHRKHFPSTFPYRSVHQVGMNMISTQCATWYRPRFLFPFDGNKNFGCIFPHIAPCSCIQRGFFLRGLVSVISRLFWSRHTSSIQRAAAPKQARMLPSVKSSMSTTTMKVSLRLIQHLTTCAELESVCSMTIAATPNVFHRVLFRGLLTHTPSYPRTCV